MSYITQTDIENLFGIENVARWSQLDNSSTLADEGRISAAIEWAGAEVDMAFADGPYELPLSPADAVVKHWAAVLAGAWLYSARGQADDDPQGTKLRESTAEVRREMALCRSGAKTLSARRAERMPTGPQVVLPPAGEQPRPIGTCGNIVPPI
jgi:phage gp36-like protein